MSFSKTPAPALPLRRAPVLGLLSALAPWIIRPQLAAFAVLPQKLWLLGGGGLLLLLLALDTLRGRLAAPAPRGASLVPVLLALWLLLSGIFLSRPSDALEASVQWLIFLAMFWCAARLAPVPGAEGWIAWPVVISAAGLSLLGLGQWAGLVDFIPQAFPPAATLGNRNMAAHLVAAGLVWSLTSSMGRRGRTRAFLWGLCLLDLAFLMTAGSKGAFLGAAAGSLAGLALALPFGTSRRVRTLPVLGLALLLALAAGAYAWLLTQPLEPAGEPVVNRGVDDFGHRLRRSMYFRLAGTRAALDMWAQAPLTGLGLRSFPARFPLSHGQLPGDRALSREFSMERAHNDPAQLLAETGAGALIFLALVLLCLRRAARAPAGAGGLPAAGAAMAVSWLAISFYSFPLSMPSATAWWALALGLAWSGGQGPVKEPEAPGWLRPCQAAGMGLLGLACLAWALWVILPQMGADRLSREGLARYTEGQTGRGLALLEEADRLNVYDHNVPFTQGNLLTLAGRFDVAEAAYLRSLLFRPNQPNAYINLALSKKGQREYADALELTKAAAAILPLEERIPQLRWNIHTALDHHFAALEDAQTLLALSSGRSPWGWYLAGHSQYRLKNYRESLRCLLKAQALNGGADGVPPGDMARAFAALRRLLPPAQPPQPAPPPLLTPPARP